MILFLDFDGVLHPINRHEGLFFCMPLFESVMREHSCVEIVISSAWRGYYELPKLGSFFSTDIGDRIIGVTPNLYVPGWDVDHRGLRETEINTWLKETGRTADPWLAIDDDVSCFSPECPRLVLVDEETSAMQCFV